MKLYNRDWLATASIAYLALPVVLFVSTWLRVEIALVCLIALVVAVINWGQLKQNAAVISPINCLLLSVLALSWVLFCGIGEFNFQPGDYDKHNLMFYDLITHAWPIVYQNADYQHPVLCYYLAYYLPTAALAKVMGGVEAARYYSLMWGWLGVWLSFMWVFRLTGQRSVWIVVAFMLISGLDLVSNALLFIKYWYLQGDVKTLSTIAKEQFLPSYLASMRLEDRLITHRLMFVSHFTDLQWVPQHALGGWVGGSILIDELVNRKRGAFIGFVLALLMLWSPFVVVGFLPIALFALIRYPHNTLSVANLFGSITLMVMTLYFKCHLPQQYQARMLFDLFTGPWDWIRYLYFIVVEVVLIASLLVWIDRRHQLLQPWRPILWISVVSLVVATWIVMGRFNDFSMRVSIAGSYMLYMVILWVLQQIYQQRLRSLPVKIFVICCLISTYEPVRQIAWTIFGTKKEPGLEKRHIATATQALHGGPDVSRFREVVAGWNISIQYLGTRDSIFGKYLLKNNN
ncbi:MAG: hypothetical protein U0Y10_21975 [Spirosomataceae bacterium]